MQLSISSLLLLAASVAPALADTTFYKTTTVFKVQTVTLTSYSFSKTTIYKPTYATVTARYTTCPANWCKQFGGTEEGEGDKGEEDEEPEEKPAKPEVKPAKPEVKPAKPEEGDEEEEQKPEEPEEAEE